MPKPVYIGNSRTTMPRPAVRSRSSRLWTSHPDATNCASISRRAFCSGVSPIGVPSRCTAQIYLRKSDIGRLRAAKRLYTATGKMAHQPPVHKWIFIAQSFRRTGVLARRESRKEGLACSTLQEEAPRIRRTPGPSPCPLEWQDRPQLPRFPGLAILCFRCFAFFFVCSSALWPPRTGIDTNIRIRFLVCHPRTSSSSAQAPAGVQCTAQTVH